MAGTLGRLGEMVQEKTKEADQEEERQHEAAEDARLKKERENMEEQIREVGIKFIEIQQQQQKAFKEKAVGEWVGGPFPLLTN